MTGVYSIAEVVDDSNKRPNKTIFCILDYDEELVFSKSQMKSLLKIAEMVEKNGSKIFFDLYNLLIHLNA